MIEGASYQRVVQIVTQVMNELSGGNPNVYKFLEQAWIANQARFISVLDGMRARDGQLTTASVSGYIRGELAGILNTQQGYQPQQYPQQYPQQQVPQYQPNNSMYNPQAGFYVSPLSQQVFRQGPPPPQVTMPQPQQPQYQQAPPPQQYTNNFMAQQYSQFSLGGGGSTMSQEVINQSNAGSQPRQEPKMPTVPPLQPQKEKYATSVEAEIPVNIKNATISEQELMTKKETEEARYVRELTMLSEKDCKNVLTLGFDNKEDAIKKFVYTSEDGINMATLYIGEIRSRGFRNVYSIKQYIEDDILSERDDGVYANIRYTKLHSIRVDHEEGVRLFKAIKESFSNNTTKPRAQLIKIKEVLDTATRLGGDSIDKFIVGMMNTYTKLGYLGRDTVYEDLVFDSISDVLSILGPTKPEKFADIWLDTATKKRVEAVLSIALKKLATIRIYSIDTAADIAMIMSCIGSKYADNGCTLRTIESELLLKASSVAEDTVSDDELQSSPCYGEIKKYTVVGLDSTIIYTNCTVPILTEGAYIAPRIIVIDSSAPDTRFEYLLSTHSSDCETAEVIIQQTPGIYISFNMYVDGEDIRIVPVL